MLYSSALTLVALPLAFVGVAARNKRPSTPTISTTIITPTVAHIQRDNGITTPRPTQPSMVDNCSTFFYVTRGDTCNSIASTNGITVSQFKTWNPSVQSDCSNLWPDTYACINIVGNTPAPTTIDPPNGVQTPTPIQPAMVKVCSTFHKVVKGESCTRIAEDAGITITDLITWNPKAYTDCSGLYANTYACVGVIRDFNFSDGTIDRFTIVDGSWDASSKSLVGSSSPGGKAVLEAPFSDFLYAASITLATSTGNAGIIFRASDVAGGADNYRGYFAGLSAEDGGYIVLGRSDLSWHELKHFPYNITAGQIYKIKVQALADEISIYVDDEVTPKFIFRDNTYRTGYNGVRVYQTGATYKHLVMQPAVFDNFERYLDGWVIADGTFNAPNRSITASGDPSGKAVLNTTFSDFSYDCDVTLTKDSTGNGGLIFRATNLGQGADNYQGYYIGISSYDGLTLGSANGTWNFLKNIKMDIRLGQSYHIQVKAYRSLMMIFVDDLVMPKMTLVDNTWTTGACGVRMYQMAGNVSNIAIVKG